MKKVTGILIFVLTLAGTALPGDGDKKSEDEALFEMKCSQCHSLNWPRKKKRTPSEWLAIVVRMRDVNDCRISDEEAKMIINYLIKNYGIEETKKP